MTQEALKDLLDAVEAAIQAGDWRVDGACDPDSVIRRAKEALSQSEQKDEKGRPMTYWGGMAQPEDHRRGADNQKASEQEPVAHVVIEPLRPDEYQRRVSVKWVGQPVAGPLYTTPPQRKPLTPDQVFAIADQHPVEGFDPEIMAFARAIEAATA